MSIAKDPEASSKAFTASGSQGSRLGFGSSNHPSVAQKKTNKLPRPIVLHRVRNLSNVEPPKSESGRQKEAATKVRPMNFLALNDVAREPEVHQAQVAGAADLVPWNKGGSGGGGGGGAADKPVSATARKAAELGGGPASYLYGHWAGIFWTSVVCAVCLMLFCSASVALMVTLAEASRGNSTTTTQHSTSTVTATVTATAANATATTNHKQTATTATATSAQTSITTATATSAQTRITTTTSAPTQTTVQVSQQRQPLPSQRPPSQGSSLFGDSGSERTLESQYPM